MLARLNVTALAPTSNLSASKGAFGCFDAAVAGATEPPKVITAEIANIANNPTGFKVIVKSPLLVGCKPGHPDVVTVPPTTVPDNY